MARVLARRKLQKNPPKYREVTKPTLIRSVLRKVADYRSATLLSFKDQSPHRSILSEPVEYGEALHYVIPDGFYDKYQAEELEGQPCYLIMYLPPEVVVAFHSEIIKATETELEIVYPETIFRVQRRRDQRYVIPPAYEINTFFEHPLLRTRQVRRLVDLSAGGMSFEIQRGEKLKFPIGMKIHNLSMTIRGRPILAGIEIKNTILIREGHRANELLPMKVGCSFIDISKQDEEYIMSYIMENTITHTHGLDD